MERDYLEHLDLDGRINNMGGVSGIYGKQERCRVFLVGRTDGKRLRGIPRLRWKKNNIGGVSGIYGRQERCVQGFGWEN
jgi:hypothetical protein